MSFVIIHRRRPREEFKGNGDMILHVFERDAASTTQTYVSYFARKYQAHYRRGAGHLIAAEWFRKKLVTVFETELKFHVKRRVQSKREVLTSSSGHKAF